MGKSSLHLLDLLYRNDINIVKALFRTSDWISLDHTFSLRVLILFLSSCFAG